METVPSFVGVFIYYLVWICSLQYADIYGRLKPRHSPNERDGKDSLETEYHQTLAPT